MSRTTNESEDEMLSKDQVDSPSIDEGIYDGSLGGGGVILKKGPWTSSEDAILVDYVKKHGEGNWNAVQKHSGLSRCGKSCRLRWANHLRPNLKKGAFTPDEERLIIELHAKMGNKWARMAANLPGRTDNEIKNYWNTRIKRRQRAGLPLYPPDLCFQSLNDSQQTHDAGEFTSGNMAHHDLFQANNYGIPDVTFDDLKGNQGGVLCHTAALSDISVSQHMLTQGLGSSQTHNFIPPTMHHPKRLQESESLFPGFTSNLTNGLPPIDQFQNDTCNKIIYPFGLSFPYNPDPNSKNPSPFGGISGSHALLNGNFSASKPIPGALKLELPSLQYPETDLGSWGMLNPQLPSLESVESFIQTPSPTRLLQSDCPSPRNSGLLEALLHESQNLNSTKNHSSEKSTSSSVVTPSDIMDSSTLNIHETGWEEYGDPISPLGCSSASVFSECTPPISGSSLDEYLPVKPLYGPSIKIETVEHESTPEVEKEVSTQLDFSRPDALLGAGWFEQGSECGNGPSTVNDAIATLLGEDFCSGYKPSWGLGSYPWNNMPAVCQMSELP